VWASCSRRAGRLLCVLEGPPCRSQALLSKTLVIRVQANLFAFSDSEHQPHCNMAPRDHHHRQHTQDPIQRNLEAVTSLLARPSFLSNLTPSRLPSRAASDSSLSPDFEAPHHARGASLHRRSHLNVVAFEDDVLEQADLVSPLIQEPCADGKVLTVQPHVLEHLESHFVGARRAFALLSPKMATERNFQTFAHGHQDLVLAVDFNYFGTRMVTASSDHRLKVWDKKDDAWSLVESWKAHDAEIVDVSGIFGRSIHL
jgi:nucleoporin SEH1